MCSEESKETETVCPRLEKLETENARLKNEFLELLYILQSVFTSVVLVDQHFDRLISAVRDGTTSQ